MDWIRRHPRVRVGAGAACALAAVLGLYLGPLGLVSQMGEPELPQIQAVSAPSHRQVVWAPPLPSSPPPDSEIVTSEPEGAPLEAADAPAEASQVEEPAADPLAVPGGDRDVPRVAAEAPSVPKAVPGLRMPTRVARRSAPRPRRPRPTVDLDTPYVTPKGNEKKRCAALIDEIVQTDAHEWVVSRELVNCYTTHLRQFDKMAYTAWKDDPDRKRPEGVLVRLSSRPDGDIARAVGVQSDDVLLSVAGVKLRSWSQVALLAPRLALNGRYRIKLRRGDETVVLTVRVKNARGVDEAREQAWPGGAEVTDAGTDAQER